MPLPRGLTPQIAEVGKIKIGYLGDERSKRNKPDEKYRLPEKLDHFLITHVNRNRGGRLVIDKELMDALIAEGYGDERENKKVGGKAVDIQPLRRIPIFLMSDEIDEVMLCQYVNYVGKRRIATCDGVTHTTHYKDRQKLGEPKTRPCDDEHLGKGWKAHTNFACVIASKAARFGGVYKFRTTSVITAQQLYGSLQLIQTMTGGVLAGLPLQLVVRPVNVSPEGKLTTVYVVHVEIIAENIPDIHQRALDVAAHRAQNYKQIREATKQYKQLLAAPGENESDFEQAEIAQEFHPEHVPASERTLPPDDPWAAFQSPKDEPKDAEFEEVETPEDREPGADEDEEPPAE